MDKNAIQKAVDALEVRLNDLDAEEDEAASQGKQEAMHYAEKGRGLARDAINLARAALESGPLHITQGVVSGPGTVGVHIGRRG